MNYLAQILKDCNKNRSSSFTEISFPIIQEIENKIKNKNGNLRKKMRQRLVDKLKLPKIEDKKQEPSILVSKSGGLLKNEKDKEKQKQKEIINYIDAYDDQKIQPFKPSLINYQTKLDQSETEVTFLIYQLMRKRKPIFKIDEVRRKIKNKQSTKRMNYKECECCQKIGRHKCPHTLCEGNCEKLKRSEKMEIESFCEDRQAIELAQQIIEQKARQENLSLTVIRVHVKQQEPLTIPKIDKTEKEEQMKEEELKEQQKEQGSLSQRGRISQNESKSQISESRRNKSKQKESENKMINQEQPIQVNANEEDGKNDNNNLQQMEVEKEPQSQLRQQVQQVKDNKDQNEEQLKKIGSLISIAYAINAKDEQNRKQQEKQNKQGGSFLDDLLLQLQQPKYEDQNEN